SARRSPPRQSAKAPRSFHHLCSFTSAGRGPCLTVGSSSHPLAPRLRRSNSVPSANLDELAAPGAIPNILIIAKLHSRSQFPRSLRFQPSSCALANAFSFLSPHSLKLRPSKVFSNPRPSFSPRQS